MTPHSLFRLSQSVYNTPHLITPSAFNVILDYLDSRNAHSFAIIAEHKAEVKAGSAKPYEDGLGILKIDGSLTYRPVNTLCGDIGTSYESLVQQVEAMAEAGVKTIVMEVTSGGGEASHCFEKASEIRSIFDAHGIRSVGYVDTVSASAAYALTCICDEVIANPSAYVGSIGCVVALRDTSKADEKAGLKRIFLASGDSKVPFAADGSFRQEFLDDIQAEVDRLNVEFASHVSKYTGLPVDTIVGFQAKCFSASTALEHGLVNKIMTTKEFAAYVAQLHKGI